MTHHAVMLYNTFTPMVCDATMTRITCAVVLALVLLAPAALAHPSCAHKTINGVVTHVRDGDTIEVSGVPIRLRGLAAPERREPGGKEATEVMRNLAFGLNVHCTLTGEVSWDRCIGSCTALFDLGAMMVARGVARDCPAYSGGRYAPAERRAAADGATISQTYQLPKYCLENGR